MKYTAKKTEFIDSKFVTDGAKFEFDNNSINIDDFIVNSAIRFENTSGKKSFNTYVDGKKADVNDLRSMFDGSNVPAEFQVREVADKLDTDYLLITVSKA